MSRQTPKGLPPPNGHQPGIKGSTMKNHQPTTHEVYLHAVRDAVITRAQEKDTITTEQRTAGAHQTAVRGRRRHIPGSAREAGEPMAERTAWRICSELGWWSAFGKKRGKNGKKPGPPVHDDLCAVNRRQGQAATRIHRRRSE